MSLQGGDFSELIEESLDDDWIGYCVVAMKTQDLSFGMLYAHLAFQGAARAMQRLEADPEATSYFLSTGRDVLAYEIVTYLVFILPRQANEKLRATWHEPNRNFGAIAARSALRLAAERMQNIDLKPHQATRFAFYESAFGPVQAGVKLIDRADTLMVHLLCAKNKQHVAEVDRELDMNAGIGLRLRGIMIPAMAEAAAKGAEKIAQKFDRDFDLARYRVERGLEE